MKILQTIKASWLSEEIRKRILITLIIIIFFRLLAAVPIPNVRPEALQDLYNSPAGGALQFLNTFAGGTLDQVSILSVGLIPFINASVIFQLLPTIIKKLENLQKEGEIGRKKLTQYSRILTFPLAILTSIGIYFTFSRGDNPAINTSDPLRIVAIVAVLTAGAMFMMWLGEIMTEKGIGNGISIIIMVGILTGIPGRFISQIAFYPSYVEYLQLFGSTFITIFITCLLIYMFRAANNIKKLFFRLPALAIGMIFTTIIIVFMIIPKELSALVPNDKIQSVGVLYKTLIDGVGNVKPVQLGMILGFAVVIIGIVTIFNEAAKNVPIYFSRKATTAVSVAKKSFMPLKVLQAGVMPIIFASALLLFPYTIAQILLAVNVQVEWLRNASNAVIGFLGPDASGNYDIRYWLLNFAFTVFFTYFYTFVLFRVSQTAENLKKNGSYIPGIRPGAETEKFLTSTMLRLVFAGAIILGIMGVTQAFVGGGVAGYGRQSTNLLSVVFTSGTSLLIVVGVVLDTRRQFKAYLAQRNYETLVDDLNEYSDVNIAGEVQKKSRFFKLPKVVSKLKINFPNKAKKEKRNKT